MEVKDDLIFDIGLHKGEDTEHYLANNFTPVDLEKEKSKPYVAYRKIKHAIKHNKLRNVMTSKFSRGSSGPFGENSKGPWKTYEKIRQEYVDFYQGELKTPINNITWLDFHGAL